MSRILLVDDSPHAQRIGERILAEEGYEVVTVSTGESALIRLDDVDPDVVVADTVMPGRNGYDICHYLKLSPRHRHVRVILTAGVMDALDEEELRRVGADGTLRKPFEATALVGAVKPLAEAVAAERSKAGAKSAPAASTLVPDLPNSSAPFVAILDPEQVRAAVTIALDAAMANMVDEITRRVVTALTAKRPFPVPSNELQQAWAPAEPAAAPPQAASEPELAASARVTPSPARVPNTETERRVNPVRVRPGSILGLDLSSLETEKDPTPPERR
ncbi:MAG: response regulator [Acidobacteriia bacterium]|nr:response regulator [Terriglobia bacterium]